MLLVLRCENTLSAGVLARVPGIEMLSSLWLVDSGYRLWRFRNDGRDWRDISLECFRNDGRDWRDSRLTSFRDADGVWDISNFECFRIVMVGHAAAGGLCPSGVFENAKQSRHSGRSAAESRNPSFRMVCGAFVPMLRRGNFRFKGVWAVGSLCDIEWRVRRLQRCLRRPMLRVADRVDQGQRQCEPYADRVKDEGLQ